MGLTQARISEKTAFIKAAEMSQQLAQNAERKKSNFGEINLMFLTQRQNTLISIFMRKEFASATNITLHKNSLGVVVEQRDLKRHFFKSTFLSLLHLHRFAYGDLTHLRL